MTILERYTDDAGKYRVMVGIDDTRGIPLKFQEPVDDSVAFAKAQEILDAEETQREIDSWITINFDL